MHIIINHPSISYHITSNFQLHMHFPLADRAVNEPNVQRTVHEPFGGKFVYVRSFSK
ncbi:hypothetical protein HanIR_Chr01g0016071 [Helianthus annuus]|nr:hypothetical protein HanIR_Chr01g0016071 [Helianthus annuus]